MKKKKIKVEFASGFLNPLNWSFNTIYSNGYDTTFQFGPFLIDVKKK